jgi:hypothetical protein
MHLHCVELTVKRLFVLLLLRWKDRETIEVDGNNPLASSSSSPPPVVVPCGDSSRTNNKHTQLLQCMLSNQASQLLQIKIPRSLHRYTLAANRLGRCQHQWQEPPCYLSLRAAAIGANQSSQQQDDASFEYTTVHRPSSYIFFALPFKSTASLKSPSLELASSTFTCHCHTSKVATYAWRPTRLPSYAWRLPRLPSPTTQSPLQFA